MNTFRRSRPGGGAFTARLRFALLVATAAVFVLIPATQSFAYFGGNMKLNVKGSGSGEVKSEGSLAGTPALACGYDGTSSSGICENEPFAFEEEEPYYITELVAIPVAGSELAGWTIQKGEPGSDGCPHIAEPPHGPEPLKCQVTSTDEAEDLEVIATFSRKPTLTISETGTGTGTVECEFDGGGLEACDGSHPKGSAVKVVATAGAGSEFGSFSGSGSATGCAGSPCEFTLGENTSLSARFVAPGLVIYLGGSAEGSVTSVSPDNAIDCGGECEAPYGSGTVVTLEAHPDSGVVFAGWVGCRHSGALTCEVTIADETEVTAIFVKNGVIGPLGPQGPKGETGSAGPQGPAGLAGSQGPAGLPGSQGLAGSTGPQGATGPAGPQGAAGKVTVTCKVKYQGKRKAKVTCTVSQSKNAQSSRIRWSLRRGGHLVSHGSTSAGGLQRVLNRLRPGRYTLHLAGQGKSTPLAIH
jgi:Collagen triple helix repeat (20 copies)/Divergent InlB B-repeat domain